jgi:hypothetical protein
MAVYKIIENTPGSTIYVKEIKIIGALAGGQLELFFIRERTGWIKNTTYEVRFVFNFIKNTKSYLGGDFDTLEEAKQWAISKCDEIFSWETK